MDIDLPSTHSSRFKMTRRRFLGSLAATAAAAVIYPCYCEPRWLDVTRHAVLLKASSAMGGDPPAGSALAKGSLSAAAASLRPVRVLHLADLHASLFVPLPMIDHAVSLGLAQKPDLICLTGDFVTNGQHFDSAGYVRVLRRLSAAAPTYAVVGNHDSRGGIHSRHRGVTADHRVVDGILEQSGIELLHNRSTQVDVRGTRLTLVGVGDLWSREVDAPRAFAGVEKTHPIMLLAHNPDTKELVRAYPWDLMLCGHTHGGQVRLPLAGSMFAPVKDKRYIAGLKPWESRQIYVTRGVGSIEGVRFRCRPEVSVLDVA